MERHNTKYSFILDSYNVNCIEMWEFGSEYSLATSELKPKYYKILANMAGSAGQFTHPSGIGGYRSYSE